MNKAVDDTLEALVQYFKDNLDTHDVSPQAVGWRNEQQQQLRFDKLFTVLEGEPGPITVNDLGCAYGALLEHLQRRSVQVALYRGYDISPKMLDAARLRLGTAGTEFHLAKAIDRPADFSFGSGLFNYRMEVEEEPWLAYVECVLDNLDANSTRGFAFNSLSTHVDWREDHLFYGNPTFFFDLCKRKYSRFVSLLHDYPLWEWTITVRKS